MNLQTQSLRHDFQDDSRNNPIVLSLPAIGPTRNPYCNIRDLTGQISGISQFALFTGGFSDIYSGTLLGENIRPRVRKVTFLPLPGM